MGEEGIDKSNEFVWGGGLEKFNEFVWVRGS